MRYATKLLLTAIAGLGTTLGASATLTEITSNITTDKAFTAADNPIYLQDTIYVTNGAKVTFGPGCIVVTLDGKDGGLVVTRGSQIFAKGTPSAPVIFTSARDVETWTGSAPQYATPGDTSSNIIGFGSGAAAETPGALGNPTTGTHREEQREWRNLTILGNGIISASLSKNPLNGDALNPVVPDGSSKQVMEGLDATEAGSDANVVYGGSNDSDDSGTLNYVSLRYGGRVLGEGKELNGLSLGAVGNGTDIEGIDIINNVDDGIEIWGGTVNIKYFNIWFVGDDSFDVDQGWRGKVQFGLIVQGYANPQDAIDNLGKSASKVQGSGAGDNIFELDGAEESTAQPQTTSVVYNVTTVGYKNGDGTTVWRDGARVQFRNMLVVDAGDALIWNEDIGSGEPTAGYSGGIVNFFGPGNGDDIWDTPFDAYTTTNQGTAPYDAATLYPGYSQFDGHMAEFNDSLIFDGTTGTSGAGVSGGNLSEGSSREAAFTLGVLTGAAGFPSSTANNVYTSTCPIVKYDRGGASQTHNSKTFTLISAAGLDPRPKTDAAYVSSNAAPADGFFTPAGFRGGFSPETNWAEGWTAADAFGFFANTGTNPAAPALTIGLSAKLSFPTVAGEFYTVYESSNGIDFTAIATVEGDGTTKSVADTADFDSSKTYKVEQQ